MVSTLATLIEEEQAANTKSILALSSREINATGKSKCMRLNNISLEIDNKRPLL